MWLLKPRDKRRKSMIKINSIIPSFNDNEDGGFGEHLPLSLTFSVLSMTYCIISPSFSSSDLQMACNTQKREFQTSAQSVVSDQPALSAQANPR